MRLDGEINNMEVIIRRMRVDDLPEVQTIDTISFSTPWALTAFRYELLENPHAFCWVAEVNSRLIGFIICWLIIDELHVATIAVHPEYRGKRISKKLIRTGFETLIDKGACLATLEVRESNFVAQSLYQSFGFKEVGLRKAYYQDTHEDALIMTVDPLNSAYLRWLNNAT
jgi:ribosomal-protein-alanine N-acetyltransferase